MTNLKNKSSLESEFTVFEPIVFVNLVMQLNRRFEMVTRQNCKRHMHFWNLIHHRNDYEWCDAISDSWVRGEAEKMFNYLNGTIGHKLSLSNQSRKNDETGLLFDA